MIIYQSSHLRVFNGEGYDKEKLLLLKYFNNYSIKQWIKTIIKIQVKLKININFNTFLVFLYKFNFINDLTNKYLKVFFKQKLLNIYLLKVYKFFFIDLSFFNKFFTDRLIITQSSLNSSLNGQNVNKFMNNNFIPYRFNNVIIDDRLKKMKYIKQYLKPIKNVYNKVENLNNTNIFVVGQVYDYYRGSITPFYNSKFSWFVSTGLKTDIECNNLEVDTILKEKPLHNLYADLSKDIIFKLTNFKSQVTNNIKKKTRHIFFYNAHNFLGLQRFLSESNSSFNYKQNNNYGLSFQFFYFYFKSSIKLSKIFNKVVNFFYKKNVTSNFIYSFSYNNTIYLNFSKLIFFLFQSIKNNLDYYYLIKQDLTAISKTTEITYRSLFSFIKLHDQSFNIINSLISDFFKKFLTKNFFLRELKLNFNKLYSYGSLMKIFMNVYSIYKSFMKDICKFINQKNLLRFFFEIFLLNKKRLILKKELYNEDLTIEEEIVLRSKLAKRDYWYAAYKKFFFYSYFHLDLIFNLNKLSMGTFNGSIYYIKLRKDVLKAYRKLHVKWYFLCYINLKDLYFFFLDFLNNVFDNCQELLYFSKLILKNTKVLDNRFFLSNVYIYLVNRKRKDFLGNDPILVETLEVSSAFLGKWFYYRQIHQFSDNLIDSYYYELKPYRALGFNLLESNFYNLKRYSFNKNNLSFNNYKLDLFFKLNIERKKSNNFHINKRFSRNKLKMMYLKIYKVKNFLWARHLTKVIDSSLNSIVNFNLPKFPKYSKFFFGYPSLKENFKGFLRRRKFNLIYKSKFLNKFLIEDDLCFSQTFLLLYNNKNVFINNYQSFWFK